MSNRLADMTDRERMYHGKYISAAQKLQTAQREISYLRDELASQAATDAFSVLCDDTPNPYTLTDIELTRLRRTLAELRAEDYERHAVAICAALDCVERIDRELRAATGRERTRGRDMGPYRRQGERIEAA